MTAPHLLFYRTDGLLNVDHIDDAGQLVQTQSSSGATLNWTYIVAVA